MIRYRLFEKEITKGNHIESHVCVDKFANHFHPKSKQYILEKQLSSINLDLSKYDYECTITSSNTTSPNNYIHISYVTDPLNPNKKFLNKEILESFKIDVNFPVLYFTRKIPFEETFKCGFYLDTYKTFKSKFFNETVEIISLFNNVKTGGHLAGDFTFDGKFIDNSINIEILPIQSKRNFYEIKEILLKNFDVKKEKIDLYDKKFENYSLDKFYFYIKIKITNNGKIVKFYRTYPNNPFLQQYLQYSAMQFFLKNY
jgi:hypothetical protein